MRPEYYYNEKPLRIITTSSKQELVCTRLMSRRHSSEKWADNPETKGVELTNGQEK
jgi:hypothetical protein